MKERDWINTHIRQIVSAAGAQSLQDDVAVMSGPTATIITMDTLVEGRHFLSDDPLDTVGQKLVRVNVSDILAKGAAPQESMLSIAWPDQYGEDKFAALLQGVNTALKAWNIALLGGDTVSTTGPLVLTLTLTGACYGKGPVRRAGACQAGSGLWLSGVIGSGAVGLREAKLAGDPGKVEGYRLPSIPGLPQARAVAAHASAAMDISDGLLLDTLTLARLNGFGVHLDLDLVRLCEPDADLAGILAQVTGGDDYQILLVGAPGLELDTALFYRVGELTAAPGLRLSYRGRDVNPPETLGFEH